jgi:hypothetical protein
MVIYSCIASPLDIAFIFEGVLKLLIDWGDKVTLVFFVLDILINLRTTYLDSKKFEK